MSQAADAITATLMALHKLEPGEEPDFRVQTQDDLVATRTEVSRTMTSLLAGIAGVSLVVGGIGIMNIMLVSVTERTREIGLRLAIGARGSDVLFQFLIEAVVISLVGGAMGVALGYGFAEVLRYYRQLPVLVPAESVAIAVAVLRRRRHLLRFLSGAEGGGARSDRSAALRIAPTPFAHHARDFNHEEHEEEPAFMFFMPFMVDVRWGEPSPRRLRSLVARARNFCAQRLQPLDEIGVAALDGFDLAARCSRLRRPAPRRSAPCRNGCRGCRARGRAASSGR